MPAPHRQALVGAGANLSSADLRQAATEGCNMEAALLIGARLLH